MQEFNIDEIICSGSRFVLDSELNYSVGSDDTSSRFLCDTLEDSSPPDAGSIEVQSSIPFKVMSGVRMQQSAPEEQIDHLSTTPCSSSKRSVFL